MTVQMDPAQFTRTLTESEIQKTVEHLASLIRDDYDGKKLVLVTVLKGGFLFAADLLKKLPPNLTEIEFIKLSSFGKDRTTPGTVTFLQDVTTDLRGKHVLIVEEIIDSGRSLKFLFDRLAQSGALSVEIVTLLDKSSKRVTEVPVKYVGRVIDDQFLVGYGLDLEERGRNLPEIYTLKYPN
jgi:hypoxanthine phosphoribosyltransferase